METKVKPKNGQTVTKTGSKPVKSFRLKGVSVSVFANPVNLDDGRSVTFFKTSMVRTFRQNDGFKTTTSFEADDLPVLMLLLQKAFDFISTQALSESEDAEEQE